MSQYSTGLSSVTNNSPTVTGTNTLWLANVTASDSFTIAGDGVMYDVASVDSDTQVTLSTNYAGTTAAGAVYAIGTSFTVPDSFPEMSQGDIETATIFTRAMRKIQSKFTAILAGGSGANFTLMPQVGDNSIVESGSNSNGDFTKFADGTMICRITKTASSATSFGSGTADSPYRSDAADYTFPVAFVTDAPVVSSSAYRNVSSTGRIAYAAFKDVTLTGITQAQAITVTNDVAPTLNFVAVGRWF